MGNKTLAEHDEGKSGSYLKSSQSSSTHGQEKQNCYCTEITFCNDIHEPLSQVLLKAATCLSCAVSTKS